MATDNELESQAIQGASRALRDESHKIPERIVLSNGIVLKVKPMPPMLLNSVSNSIPKPPVPMVFLEDKGRDEPNPNDPNYIQAEADRQTALSLAIMNTILYACTEIEEVPANCWGVESEEWLALPRLAGIKFDPDDKIERYLTWLRSYAIATMQDMNKAQTLPLMLAGITEPEVDDVMESFRSGETPGTDNPVPTEIGSVNGNHVHDDTPRPRARAGRA